MDGHHDGASGSLAQASADGEAPGIDPLSDVLRAVRLTGAVFFRVDATSPWVIEMPDTSALASVTLPRAQHVISYHVVTRGSCWGALLDGAAVRLEAGDVLVFPHGDAYVMSMAPGLRGGPDRSEVLAFMGQMITGRLPFTVVEDGGGRERLGSRVRVPGLRRASVQPAPGRAAAPACTCARPSRRAIRSPGSSSSRSRSRRSGGRAASASACA